MIQMIYCQLLTQGKVELIVKFDEIVDTTEDVTEFDFHDYVL